MFGGDACRVEGCGRTARGRGLCQGHLHRWVDEGRPDLEQFVRSPIHAGAGNALTNAAGCLAADMVCPCGDVRSTRSAMAASRSAGPERVAGRCRGGAAAGSGQNVPHPALRVVAARDITVLPVPHEYLESQRATRHRGVRRPLRRDPPLASEVIRLDRLNPQLKLEMQYVLQRRHDERQGKLTPHVVMRVVRMLADADVASLLDHDEDAWNERIQLLINDNRARGLFGYAYRAIADLAEAGGWEAEFPRDVWRMRRLGYDGDRTLRFGGIPQPWLRDLAKRWIRWRLSSGLGLEAGGARPVVVITRFARFLADIGITGSTGSTGRCSNATSPTCAVSASAPNVAPATSACSTGSSPPSANTVGTLRFPPTRFLRRGLPQTRRTAAAGAGRARHGPARAPGQPRPLRRPLPPADHDHPDALRAADHRRAAAARRLRHRRRRGRPVSALLQPQDETRRAACRSTSNCAS